MKKRDINALQALVLFICGAAGPVALGLWWVGSDVFDFHTQAVKFLLYGIGCSFVFVLHRWLGLVYALVASFVLSVIFALSPNGLAVSGLIHAAFILLATVFVREFMWGKIFSHAVIGKFIHTALVLTAGSFVATMIVSIANSETAFTDSLMPNAAQACLVGIGLGLGIEIGAILIGRPGEVSSPEEEQS